jgi:hypothetical protein
MEKFRNWYEENGKAIHRQEIDFTKKVEAISSKGSDKDLCMSEETKEGKEKKKKKK